MRWRWHWHFLCVQVGAEMEFLLHKKRSMQLWLLLHTNHTKMQHLKNTNYFITSHDCVGLEFKQG